MPRPPAAPSRSDPREHEPAHRGRNATAYPGSGLGLAIVKTIIESHGGEVKVESPATGARESRLFGTRFLVRLPVVVQG